MPALTSQAPLIVYVDIKSPYAFVAIGPTLALEAELGLNFDWRPLTLDIPSYAGSARKSGGRLIASNRSPSMWRRIRYSYMDARRYAERQGLKLLGTEKIWDSSIANIGIRWVSLHGRDRLPDYFDTVYPRFWQRQLDIEDVGVVADCIEQAGVSARGFQQWQQEEGRTWHDELQAQLLEAGVYGVPSYICNGQVLFGREHLTFVRWHLTGRQGPAPDMAYSL